MSDSPRERLLAKMKENWTDALAETPHRHCDGCGAEIVVGQHYMRGAVLADTAGMERVFDVPDMIWDGIFDTPACLALALLKSAKDPATLLYDVFGR